MEKQNSKQNCNPNHEAHSMYLANLKESMSHIKNHLDGISMELQKGTKWYEFLQASLDSLEIKIPSNAQPMSEVPPTSKILTLEAGGNTATLEGWLQYFKTIDRKFASPKDLLSERVLTDAGAINLIRHNIGEGPILFPLSLDYSNDKVDVTEHIVKSFPGVFPPKTEYGVYAPKTDGWNTLINFCQKGEDGGTSLVKAIFGLDISVHDSLMKNLFGVPLTNIYLRTPDKRGGKDRRRTLEITLNPEDNILHINCGAIPDKTYGVAFGIIPEAVELANIMSKIASSKKPAQP